MLRRYLQVQKINVYTHNITAEMLSTNEATVVDNHSRGYQLTGSKSRQVRTY
jgi:hypothetical protein